MSAPPAPRPLRPGDPALPAVRARLAALAWALWRQRVLDEQFLPLATAPADPPLLHLLSPLWQRLRLALLGETLFATILPAIERQMAAAGSLVRRPAGLAPTAPVDWPATWRATSGQTHPETVITRRWQRTLDLPENRLAVLATQTIATDVRTALRGDDLPPDERAGLHSLGARAARALARPPWHSLQPEPPADLLPAAGIAIARSPAGRRAPYAALLDWWQRYSRWRQTALGPTALPLAATDPDLLFELLVLFEMATALARHLPLRQVRPLGGDPTAPLFVAQTTRGPLTLFYQTGTMFAAHRRLGAIWGTPDIVIGLPDERYVILDAKNVAPGNHAQALYKLMGYLYNFGYRPAAPGTATPAPEGFERIVAGVIVFPSPAEREGPGLTPWHDPATGGQAILSLVLPPLPDAIYTGIADLAARVVAGGEWSLERGG